MLAGLESNRYQYQHSYSSRFECKRQSIILLLFSSWTEADSKKKTCLTLFEVGSLGSPFEEVASTGSRPALDEMLLLKSFSEPFSLCFTGALSLQRAHGSFESKGGPTRPHGRRTVNLEEPPDFF